MELEIITSTETAVKTSIKEIYIPAFFGEAGILENHLPYISILDFGEISYLDTQGIHHFLYIEKGFIRNSANRITIISDSIEKAEEMDGVEVQKRFQELDGKIKSAPGGGISPPELQEALIQQRKMKVKVDMLKKLEQR
jgi:F-type H+-transporting ATPase subunit epsilon